MIIGMNRILTTHRSPKNLDGPVGDHLVDIHIGLGPTPCLPDHQWEVGIKLPVDDFISDLAYNPHLLFFQKAKPGISSFGQRTGLRLERWKIPVR